MAAVILSQGFDQYRLDQYQSAPPGDVWVELFVKAWKEKKLDDDRLRYQRNKLIRAFFLGLPAVGQLVYDGRYNLGLDTYDWWRCTTCGDTFPVIDGHVSCNRTRITICPWCRHDSTPGRFGA